MMNSGRKRGLLPHLKNINHAVMTVGGWFDAEDLSGPLNIYKTIEKTSPKAKNTIVMGPFPMVAGLRSRENISTVKRILEIVLLLYYQKKILKQNFSIIT